MNSAGQKSGYATVRTAPEILDGAGAITREADVFAFGMVMIEVSPYPLSHLVSKVEVRLTCKWCPRFSQEATRSVNSQPRSLLQKFLMANCQLVRRRHEG